MLFLHNCDDFADLDTILNGWMYAYAKELKETGRAKLIGLSTHSTDIALAAVKSGKLDVLMFPVNPLFNLLPQDSADARMKGREVRSMTRAERDAYPTKQELYDLCGEMGVPIAAMKPFAAGNILKGHEEGRLKGLLELTPVQCISYVLSIPQVACPVPGFAGVDELVRRYSGLSVPASKCIHCGACTKRCPFGIDAEGNIHRAQETFGF